MLHARRLIGTHNILFITLDTLRYDVAVQLHASGKTPHLASVIAHDGWERRHTPGSFTLSAHAAFFAGFLPTPARPGTHPRLFALRFPGSETTAAETARARRPGHRGPACRDAATPICIGGVGFFNKRTPLGTVLPGLFDESHWSPALGVTEPRSTENQVASRSADSRTACRDAAALPVPQRLGHPPAEPVLPARGRREDCAASRTRPRWRTWIAQLGRAASGLTAARAVARGRLLGPRHGLRRGRLPGHRLGAPGRVGRCHTPSSSCAREPP